jgi:FkbM family methyltransferase
VGLVVFFALRASGIQANLGFGTQMIKKLARMLGYSLQKIRRSDDEEDVLHMALKLTQPTLALDCGANKGAFVQLLRNVGFGGTIWCFEPNRDCIQVLNTILGGDPRTRVFPFATGSEDRTLELQVAGEDGNMSSLLPHAPLMAERCRSAYVREAYEVPVRRLDEVLDLEGLGQTERILLKMDTQGYDCETFKGLGKRLRQVVAVKAEFSVNQIYQGAPPHWEMLDLLRMQQFEPILFSTISRHFDGRMIEYDALFIKTAAK